MGIPYNNRETFFRSSILVSSSPNELMIPPCPGRPVPRHGLPRGDLLQVRAGGLPAAQPVAELQSPAEGALLPSPGDKLTKI